MKMASGAPTRRTKQARAHKVLTPEDREAIAATIQRFYCDPQHGAIRAVAEMIDAFDFSVDPPRQIREISPYAAQRIAAAFQSYFRGSESLDEAFGFRGTGRGSRSAISKYRQAQTQYRIVFDYISAREDGKSYDDALASTAAQNNTSSETVRRFIKK